MFILPDLFLYLQYFSLFYRIFPFCLQIVYTKYSKVKTWGAKPYGEGFRMKKLIILFLGACTLIASSFWLRSTRTSPNEAIASENCYMTVFVHGSFSSFLGFLSLPNVMKDAVKNTTYCNVTKQLRNDEAFYTTQPMLKRGLVRLEPSYTKENANNRPYAAYPIIKAFQDVLANACPEQKENYFYTFGWSGLISQNSRRYEAIRFYNALCEELEKFHKQGIYPKIRIITHSHGGGLCLNMAGVSRVLHNNAWRKEKVYSQDKNEQESLAAITTIFKELTNKDTAEKKADQKALSYVPIHKNLKVAELILLGTPLQPETEHFFKSPFFEKIYHIYSDEDVVQRLDWVSSKELWSNQRLSTTVTPTVAQSTLPKVTQIRIILDKNKGTTPNNTQDPQKASTWEHIVSAFTGRQTRNPTHEELWFLTWQEKENQTFLSPLPISILTPFLIKETNAMSTHTDVDVYCLPDGDSIKMRMTPYNKETVTLQEHMIPQTLIKEIQKNIEPWREGAKTSPHAEVSRVYNTLTKTNSQS